MSVAGPWFLSELAAGCVGLLLLLSPLAILVARRRHGSGLIYGACALASCALALVALLALLSPAPPGAIELAVGLPLGRTILGYDPLGAAFALIINVATTLVSGYAIRYGAHAREPQRVVPFYPAFIAGMNLVLLSRDAFSFLVGWEFMSLASWALVASDHACAENRRAALVYLIMATAGALTLLFAFGLLAGPAGGYGFAEMRHTAHVAAAPLVLVLALIGAGSKAGLVPLHAWLPLAHPAAPSHVSALMSGVMTKVAVYGFIRIVFDLAGPPSWLWSLGGLIHRMPVTALAFLAGCIAISALPPFNGFVSEWLTFQAILLSPQLPQWVPRLIVPAVGATLACAAALAATCFVKAFGMTFLGRSRSTAAAEARETDGWSQVAMLLLALLCLLAGVLPGLVMDALAPVMKLLLGARLAVQSSEPWLRIVPIDSARSAYDGALVLGMIAIAAAATALIVRRFASHALRRAPAWDCGFPDASPATQYTAGSFAQPIRRVFGGVVFRAREHLAMPAPGDTGPARLEVELHDTLWEALYAPVIRLVDAVSARVNLVQFLTIRRYLTLVVSALVLLLIIVGATR